jgi:mannitol/fructose-specific phosphotransferase system IIA component
MLIRRQKEKVTVLGSGVPIPRQTKNQRLQKVWESLPMVLP